MRMAAQEQGIECVIASVSVIQVAQYIDKADFVLVAPQLEHEYKRILQYARPLQIPVLLIGRKSMGKWMENPC